RLLVHVASTRRRERARIGLAARLLGTRRCARSPEVLRGRRHERDAAVVRIGRPVLSLTPLRFGTGKAGGSGKNSRARPTHQMWTLCARGLRPSSRRRLLSGRRAAAPAPARSPSCASAARAPPARAYT